MPHVGCERAVFESYGLQLPAGQHGHPTSMATTPSPMAATPSPTSRSQRRCPGIRKLRPAGARLQSFRSPGLATP